MLDKAKMREAHIDYEVGVKRFAGKEALYEKYLMKFIEDTHYQEAYEALEMKDYDKILKTVHALKGMTGTLGMEQLFRCCALVVSDIREDRKEEVEEHFRKLSEEYKLAVAFIETMK